MNEAMTEQFEDQLKIPEIVPVLTLRDVVIFPYIIVPLSVSRPKSIQAVEQALAENRMILLLSQKDQEDENPEVDDLYAIGTVAVIMRMLKLPDGRVRILTQGVNRARVEYFTEEERFFQAKIEPLPEPAVELKALEVEALMRNVKSALDKSVALGKAVSSEVMVIATNIEDPGRLADLVASNLDMRISEAQEILETVHPVERLKRVNQYLNRELQLLTMQQEINTQAKGEMDKTQREYFLRQQLKAIQAELGVGNELAAEVAQIREKLKEAKMPAYALEEVEKQLTKLERMHPESAETATLRNYIEVMTELPWGKVTRDNLDLKKAQQILDEDHYGLEPIKERILEFLSVRKLRKEMKGPILCFVGPPGVGKTSLGRSIARALGRKFTRLSLGGVRDEAEIRGHRRTYVGAMPGRIIQGIQVCGTSNPVFMLDEVDKIGADFRGDPSSALLEVLDPEQNFAFRDHYLSVPYDLSNVMFITTANLLDPIQPAFRDRMEVIQLSGYTEEEKVEIAARHLIPKQLAENGLKPRDVSFNEKTIRRMVNEYTREAGLRNLERQFATALRKVARRHADGNRAPCRLTPNNLQRFLGNPRLHPDEILKKDEVGVATGLAWTVTGGEILFVEATTMKGKGSLILTGQLGDVMKESARAGLSFTRTHAEKFGITEEYFVDRDLHIHIPEGAIPKDGPSAGITVTIAMISAFTGRPVRKQVAMTGEITLRGNVLPVGGVKEKILAARRAKLEHIIVPALNRGDVEEIPAKLRRRLTFSFVDSMFDVINIALIEKPVNKVTH